MTKHQSRESQQFWMPLVWTVLGIFLALFVLFGVQSPEPSAPQPTAQPPIIPPDSRVLQPIAGESNLYIEYILDASASMLDPLSDGVSKRDASTEALLDHLRDLRPETHIGLRVYGHRVPWQDNREESCEDIELAVPIGVGQVIQIADWLQSFDNLGWTPLHASVDQALNDFDTTDPDRFNNILLISDGMETCDQDPCQLVELTRQQGVNLTFHVIGVDVDEPTRAQLMCIAEMGGGLYFDIANSADFSSAFNMLEQQMQEQSANDVVAQLPATSTAVSPVDVETSTPVVILATQAPPTAVVATPAPPTAAPPTQAPPTAVAATPVPPTPVPPTALPPTQAPTITLSPTPLPPTATPMSSCIRPQIVEFYAAAPSTCGSDAPNFVLHWVVQGADRVEIFGHVVDPVMGSFPVFDGEPNNWSLWAKVDGTPDDCFSEVSQPVNPDTLSCMPGFDDVSVGQRNIQLSVRDFGLVDGDRIDVAINGNQVLSNYTLTGVFHSFDVTLQSGNNTFVVTALNEGSRSPNTVEVRVSNVTVGSSLQVSQGMRTGETAGFTIRAP